MVPVSGNETQAGCLEAVVSEAVCITTKSPARFARMGGAEVQAGDHVTGFMAGMPFIRPSFMNWKPTKPMF